MTFFTRRGVVLLLALFTGHRAMAQSAADSQSLIGAAARGDLPTVMRLIAGGADLGATDGSGRTALLAATQGNHAAVARALIEAGADVNAKDNIQDSPYLLAGARGYLEILRMTLARGADLKSVNRYGGTALIPACERGHVETVRELLKTSINIDHVNRLGWTCLLEAVVLGDGGPRHQEIVRMLIAAKADLNLPDRDAVTPLQHARAKRQSEIARLLAEAGAR